MGKYSLQTLPLSPNSYGKPTNKKAQIQQKPIEIFDGKFVRVGTLSKEIERLYKDEEEIRATTLDFTAPHNSMAMDLG